MCLRKAGRSQSLRLCQGKAGNRLRSDLPSTSCFEQREGDGRFTRRTASTSGDGMSADENRAARHGARELQEQSAAAPSPFPPIADYAFLSNCHTGALVAADGAVDSLCVPAPELPAAPSPA